MKNQKMTIIAVVACCVAVFAVLLLILFLTGVITTGSQVGTVEKDVEELPTSKLTPYEYLSSIGSYKLDNCTMLDDEYGDWTEYSWKSEDGVREIVKFTSDSYLDSLDTTFYQYYNWEARTNACISDLGLVDDPDEQLAYGEFISWCEENNLTPDEVMEALDQYSESVK